MSVYVDAAIWPFGRMVMCHMIADSEEELLAMADKIGVARKWIQRGRVTHFDICKAKRALAVKAGAIEVDRKQFVEATKQKTCVSFGCDRAALVWMKPGESRQTRNGFLIAKAPEPGYYCPSCAASYGPMRIPLKEIDETP